MKYLNRLVASYPILNHFKSQLSLMEIDQMYFEVKEQKVLKQAYESCLGFPFLLNGSLYVSKINEEGEITYLYSLKPGDVCHHAFRCILDNKEYGIQVAAKTNCELIIIPIPLFKQYFLTDYRFLNFLYSDLFKKLDLISTNKEALVHDSVEQRLYNYLSERENKTVKITHQQLADELCSAREVISRQLKQLEKQGFLKLHRGSIEIYTLK